MLPLTMCENFTGQNFYPTKFSPVKFSPLELTGEIGENLPLAKISRYTVVNKAFQNYSVFSGKLHSCGLITAYRKIHYDNKLVS